MYSTLIQKEIRKSSQKVTFSQLNKVITSRLGGARTFLLGNQTLWGSGRERSRRHERKADANERKTRAVCQFPAKL